MELAVAKGTRANTGLIAMPTCEEIANWMEEAAAAAKRGGNTAKEESFRNLWKARHSAIVSAQAQLRQLGGTPLETFIESEKKKGGR